VSCKYVQIKSKSCVKLKVGTDKLKHRIFFAGKMAVPEVADTFFLCGKKYRTKVSPFEPSSECSHEKYIRIPCHHLNRATHQAHHCYFFDFTILIIAGDLY
jgi:hypothetical protein